MYFKEPDPKQRQRLLGFDLERKPYHITRNIFYILIASMLVLSSGKVSESDKLTKSDLEKGAASVTWSIISKIAHRIISNSGKVIAAIEDNYTWNQWNIEFDPGDIPLSLDPDFNDSQEYPPKASTAISWGNIDARTKIRPPLSAETEGPYKYTQIRSIYSALPQNIKDDLDAIFIPGTKTQLDKNAEILVEYSARENSRDLPRLDYVEQSVNGALERYYLVSSVEDVDGKQVISTDFYSDDGSGIVHQISRRPLRSFIPISSSFGPRKLGDDKRARLHTGTDFPGNPGEPIITVSGGTLRFCHSVGGYGLRCEYRVTRRLVIADAHMVRFAQGMIPGTQLSPNAVIGFVGNSGHTSGIRQKIQGFLIPITIGGYHDHHETIQDGVFTDSQMLPINISDQLTGNELADFKAQKVRILERVKTCARSIATQVNSCVLKAKPSITLKEAPTSLQTIRHPTCGAEQQKRHDDNTCGTRPDMDQDSSWFLWHHIRRTFTGPPR